jgi:hypothetical protein
MLKIFFYKTIYLNEEINGTETSLSDSVPWFRAYHFMSLSPLFPGGLDIYPLSITVCRCKMENIFAVFAFITITKRPRLLTSRK